MTQRRQKGLVQKGKQSMKIQIPKEKTFPNKQKGKKREKKEKERKRNKRIGENKNNNLNHSR